MNRDELEQALTGAGINLDDVTIRFNRLAHEWYVSTWAPRRLTNEAIKDALAPAGFVIGLDVDPRTNKPAVVVDAL